MDAYSWSWMTAMIAHKLLTRLSLFPDIFGHLSVVPPYEEPAHELYISRRHPRFVHEFEQHPELNQLIQRERQNKEFVAVRLLTWHRLRGWLHSIVPVHFLLHFAEGNRAPVAYLVFLPNGSAEEQAVWLPLPTSETRPLSRACVLPTDLFITSVVPRHIMVMLLF